VRKVIIASVAGILVLVAGLVVMANIYKVPAGNVGIKVYLLGGSKGVDVEEKSPGRHWVGFNEEMYLFPTFTQNYTWAKDCQEGDCTNEEVGFQTAEGLPVTADVGISYHIRPEKAALVFQKYRKGVDEITDIYLRNMVRDSLVKNGSTLPVETVYGKGKTDLIAKVQKDVTEQVQALGIVIEKIYWVGELRLPPTVTQAINAKITMTQEAQRAQNQVAKAKAEADVKIANALGSAESLRIISEAQANAIRVKAQAITANPEIVQMTAVEKWDGHLPTTNAGGALPFINIK
jgi:regulator of protease activity HflC (stomatin/prohibitin superfamily)